MTVKPPGPPPLPDETDAGTGRCAENRAITFRAGAVLGGTRSRGRARAAASAMHADVEGWSNERDQLRDAVLTRGWSEARQAYAQTFGCDELDAAQLLMPILGFLPICSFWLVSALAKAGEIARAELLFDKLVAYAGDLGLLAEQIDTANGELLGNFPQAFSHVGLITAAWEIDKARGQVA